MALDAKIMGKQVRLDIIDIDQYTLNLRKVGAIRLIISPLGGGACEGRGNFTIT